MKQTRFISFTWLTLLPILAIAKIFFELTTFEVSEYSFKPFPLNFLDQAFPINLYIGIGGVFLATYFTFAYVNAYINLQNTYLIALVFGILSLLAYRTTLTSLLIALSIFMLGVFQTFSIKEKQHPLFRIFNSGFLIGISLFFDIHFIFLILPFSLSLFLLRLNFRHFLQFWAGVALPILIAFPILYSLELVAKWQSYLLQNINTFSPTLTLNTFDYGFVGIIVIFVGIQSLQLFTMLRKPYERTLLLLLILFFIFSLFLGVFCYPNSTAYFLLCIPSLTLLYSLPKHQNQIMPTLLIFFAFCFVILRTFLP